MYESISKNNELENEMTLDMSYFWYSDVGGLRCEGSHRILGDCCKWEPSCNCNGDTLCGEWGRVCGSGVVTELVPRGVDYIGASPCKFSHLVDYVVTIVDFVLIL